MEAVSYSCASPCGPAVLVTQDPNLTFDRAPSCEGARHNLLRGTGYSITSLSVTSFSVADTARWIAGEPVLNDELTEALWLDRPR